MAKSRPASDAPRQPLPGVALVEARRRAMRPAPAESVFAEQVLGISRAQWTKLKLGQQRFGWRSLGQILERYPDLRDAMRRGDFGQPPKHQAPPLWAYDKLPELVSVWLGEEVKPPPDQ